MKKNVFLSLVTILTIFWLGVLQQLLFAQTTSTKAKPLTITAVSMLGADHDTSKSLFEFKKNVEKLSNGAIKIEYKGGPESIPSMQQPKAVMDGVVDLALSSAGYYTSILPSVTGSFLSPYTPTEERQNGVYDFYVEQEMKADLRYLGRGNHGIEQACWCIYKLDSPRKLAGLTFRSNPIYNAAFKALGINRITMEMTDIHTGLERKMVEGLIVPISVIMGLRLNEYLPYMYLPPIWGTSMEFEMNLKKWKSIPKEQQDLIMKAIIETEKWVEVYYPGTTKADYKAYEEKGGKIITWTGPDAKWYVDTAQDAKWKELTALDQVNVPKLRKLFEQKK